MRGRTLVEVWINGIQYIGWATWDLVEEWKRTGFWQEDNDE